jgi:hypothetical protein
MCGPVESRRRLNPSGMIHGMPVKGPCRVHAATDETVDEVSSGPSGVGTAPMSVVEYSPEMSPGRSPVQSLGFSAAAYVPAI